MIADEKKSMVSAFYKQAFAIDGEVTYLSTGEARELLQTHTLQVMMLTDSKRGTFYTAVLQAKPQKNPDVVESEA